MYLLKGKNKTKSMASSEQGPYGAGYGPDFINTAVNRAVSSVEVLGTGVEINGFRGDMAPRISEWQERGLGRAIGVPFVLGGSTIEDKFHGIAYALPLTGRNVDPMGKQSLLLFPTEINTRFLVVTPQPVSSWNPVFAANGNAQAAGQFSALLDPSRRPHIDSSWRVDFKREPAFQFLDAISSTYPYIRFSSEVWSSADKDQVLRQALWQAMDREVVDVGEGALVARLSNEASGLLGVANDAFGGALRARQERHERRSQAVRDGVDSMLLAGREAQILDKLDFNPDSNS